MCINSNGYKFGDPSYMFTGLSLLMHPLNEAWLKLEIEPYYKL